MRYLPLNASDRSQMLDVIGVDNIDALFEDVPKPARLKTLVDLPLHQSEQAVERHMSRLSSKSISASSVPFFCGAGAYKHHNGLYALPAGNQPRHAASFVRVSNASRAPHRHGSRECVYV